MKIQQVMTTAVKSCRPETNVAEAVRIMWEQDCGVLPVVDADGKVIGVVTDRDICIAVGTRGLPADRIAVRDVAAGNVYTCSASDEVAVALRTMRERRVRRVPVVDAEGRLAGILSLNDVVLQPEAAAATEVVKTFRSICEHRPPVSAPRAA